MTGSTADRRRFLRLIRRSCAAALDVIALTHAHKVEKAAIAGLDGTWPTSRPPTLALRIDGHTRRLRAPALTNMRCVP